MSVSSRIINNCGEDILIDGVPAKGFLSAAELSSAPAVMPLPNGIRHTARYRLLTDEKSVREGSRIICCGRAYEVKRREDIRIFGSYSHTEAILALREDENAE